MTHEHIYDGNHEDGWTCGICGDHQDFVNYSQTVDYQRHVDGIKQAHASLDRTVERQGLENFRRGLAEAVELIKIHKTPGQSKVAIRMLIEDIDRAIEAIRSKDKANA